MEKTECFETSAHKIQTWGLFLLTSPMKMEQREYFETLAHKIQIPGNLPAYTTYEDGTDRMFRNVGA